MLNLFTQKQTALGLDLSDISVKIMQLERHGSGYRTIGYADHDLPRGIMVNDVIVNEDSLVEHLHKVFEKQNYGKVTTKNIIASIPESKAFVRVIQVPLMSEEQAENAVPFEAEQYIPMPLDQVNLDWEILRKGEEKMDVLVTASPREYVESFLRIFKKAGLRPVSFEVESAACARALISPEKKNVPALILDMDTFRTSLIIIEGGSLQFTSSVPIAGDAFTQSIARTLGIQAQEAENIKRAIGLDDSEEFQSVRTALSPVVDNLVSEIKNIVHFHDEHAAEPIKQILLCGGTAKLKGLTSYLYKQMQDYSHIDIGLGDPWVNVPGISKDKGVQPILKREDAISYTTAIGLAIRGANLN